MAKSERFNNFQRKETAMWLLNMSQAVAVGGVVSLFIPGAGERVGIVGIVALTGFAFILYFIAMYIGRKVKDE